MTTKRFPFASPIKVSGKLYVEALVNDKEVLIVTDKGKRVPINLTTAATIWSVDYDDNSYENRLAVVQKIYENSPLSWKIEGDQLIGITAAGKTIPSPLSEVKQCMGLDDEALLLKSLSLSFLEEESEKTRPQALAFAIVLGPIVSELGKGLVKAILSKVAAKLLEELFPHQDIKSYFDELYEKLTRLVHQEISTNVIQQINGTINGTLAFIKNEYLPRKDVVYDKAGGKEELLRKLQIPISDFYKNNYILREDNYRKPGFSVFLFGVCVHLLLLQEAALADPLSNNPQESSYAKSVSKQAEDYINMAQKTWSELAEERRNKIVQKAEYIQLPYQQQKIFVRGTVTDEWTNTIVFVAHDPLSWMCSSENIYKQTQDEVVQKLSNELAGDGGVDGLLSNWKKLISNPIPKWQELESE